MKIRPYNQSDRQSWDAYVNNHPEATHCHLSGWKDVIEKTYGHKGYYLLAEEDSIISGILPLFHIKSFLFGNQLVSMPFLNYGGILADNEETEIALLSEGIKLGQKLRVSSAELRHVKPISSLNPTNSTNPINSINSINSNNPMNYSTKTNKVRMVLKLPVSKEEIFKSFKSKLRSQISRPQKEGMKALIGGSELLDSFYKVFSINMRDLGSPVHSKNLFKEICLVFNENVKIGIVECQNIPVAGGMIFCFRNTIEIPWASSLKQYNKSSPNMLLYWSLIGFACDKRFKYFDFGRSTPGEGTYKFKEQWGAIGIPLHWQYWTSYENNGIGVDSKNPKYDIMIKVWQKIPVSISTWLGPKVRKSIAL